MDELAVTAAAGDRLATLRALRDRLAVSIDGTGSARDLAALSRQLTEVLGLIAECERAAPKGKGTPLDELASRRVARGAGAAGGKGAAGGVVGG